MRRAAAVVAALLALAVAAPAAAQQASLPDIEDEVMCPICGTTLELSQAPQADRERELIRALIAQGLTKEQVKDRLVAEYGPDVLAEPEGEGFDLAAWLLPLVGLAAAVLGVGLALRRWRRQGADPGPEPQAPSGEAAERLDSDISRYDL